MEELKWRQDTCEFDDDRTTTEKFIVCEDDLKNGLGDEKNKDKNEMVNRREVIQTNRGHTVNKPRDTGPYRESQNMQEKKEWT